MLLKREEYRHLILYDDHGETWSIMLEREADARDTAGGNPVAPLGSRVIRFLGPDAEQLRVAYEGAAMHEDDLVLDEVVVHLLKARG